MIQVNKPPTAPTKLNEGEKLTKEDCESFTKNAVVYQRGEVKFTFNQKIYNHKTVKNTLRNAQFQKCCFCEGKFGANAYGDIEHYRPKGAVQQDKWSRQEMPGYFWLAYSWDNLYWCCQVCNRGNKKNLFPLRNPSSRARSFTDCLSLEEPLILDPGGSEDPRQHINFRKELAVSQTEEGETTIRVLGLNRPDLVEERRTKLAELQVLLCIVKFPENSGPPEYHVLKEQAIQMLAASVEAGAKFSSMATDCLNEMQELMDPNNY